MTPERRKALLIIAATFVGGIIIGALVTGMFARQFYHGRDGGRTKGKDMRDGRRGSLTDKIYRVVKADSSQRERMKPIIEQAMTQIDSLEARGDREAKGHLDSLKVKLRPILSSDQMETLEKFLSFKHKPENDHEKGHDKKEHEKGHEHHGRDHK